MPPAYPPFPTPLSTYVHEEHPIPIQDTYAMMPCFRQIMDPLTDGAKTKASSTPDSMRTHSKQTHNRSPQHRLGLRITSSVSGTLISYLHSLVAACHQRYPVPCHPRAVPPVPTLSHPVPSRHIIPYPTSFHLHSASPHLNCPCIHRRSSPCCNATWAAPPSSAALSFGASTLGLAPCVTSAPPLTVRP